jgi:hypothetical protein
VKDAPVAQSAGVPASTLHVFVTTVEVASVAVKASETGEATVALAAGAVMLTTGAAVSTLKVVDAVAVPAAFVAETVTVWLPWANAV